MTRKVQYKPRSWKDYNKALIERGNIFLWISEGVLKAWEAPRKPERGAPRQHSDLAIQAILALKYLLNLPLRATQGFVSALFKELNISLPVAHCSTLSRRLGQLPSTIKAPPSEKPMAIAIDSSGLKVHGEGEWKVRMHGYSKRRTWRKFHIAIDVEAQMIHAATVTTNDFKDNEVFEETIAQVEGPIQEVLGDGA